MQSLTPDEHPLVREWVIEEEAGPITTTHSRLTRQCALALAEQHIELLNLSMSIARDDLIFEVRFQGSDAEPVLLATKIPLMVNLMLDDSDADRLARDIADVLYNRLGT